MEKNSVDSRFVVGNKIYAKVGFRDNGTIYIRDCDTSLEAINATDGSIVIEAVIVSVNTAAITLSKVK